YKNTQKSADSNGNAANGIGGATAGGDEDTPLYSGPFLPGFVEQIVPGEDAGIQLIDHIVGNVELGRMNYWCDFYRDVMGFERYITF
ncbi:hypothetical protein J0681_24400, partial [Vibrio parahaemolyticus]|nr:hypothetical protein [Vibrio parahaemolyticus]